MADQACAREGSPTATAAGPGQTIAVVVNRSSGVDRKGVPEERLREVFTGFGLEVDVITLTPGCDLKAALRQRNYRAAVAAGGDGTVSAVAAAIAGTEMPLGVIPGGTFNHFAKDAGIPLDLAAAAAVIAAGKTSRFDIAEVNRRVFINNSSLGLYPTLVLERDRLVRKGWPKTMALAIGSLKAFRVFPNLTVRVHAEGAAAVLRTPLVFVGNNEYEFSGLNAGTRANLRAASLQLCIVHETRRAGVLKLTLLALLGRLETAREFTATTVQGVRVDTFRRRVRIAIDGELVVMNSPLIYTVRPGALRVLTPEQGE